MKLSSFNLDITDNNNLDRKYIMVALNRPSPSTFSQEMSSQEIENYLIEMLGINRPIASSQSFGGDVPQPLDTATSSPNKWNFVVKTQPGPSSYKGRYAGTKELHKAHHTGLYTTGVKTTLEASSKNRQGHL
jgi:hypothetical protein